MFLIAVVAACSEPSGGMDSTPDAAPRGPRFFEDVAPILATHCLRCHTPDGIAPISLVTYEDVMAEADGVMLKVAAREMPPYLVNSDGSCQQFKEVTRLGDDEIATIIAWVQGDRRKGDPAKAPALPGALPSLADATATAEMSASYTPNKLVDDDYRCFILDSPVSGADGFLTAYEFEPGDKRVVHHAILFAMNSPEAEARAQKLDDEDPAPGYTCFGGTRTGSDFVLAGWAPGTRSTSYAADTGIRVRAGRKMVLQVHYNLANGVYPDRSKMKLKLVDHVAKEAFNLPLAWTGLKLAPGKAYVTDGYVLDVPSFFPPAQVWAVYPHMHTLGRTLKVELIRDGQTTCMVDIPAWSFNWQRFYEYDSPLEVRGGDQVRITCGYDTSHRTEMVTWGEGTEDEMCLAGFYLTTK